MVSGMQTGSPTQKIIAMVPRGSQKTACLNYPPGHENDPKTLNGQRHSAETGTLLDLPRQLQWPNSAPRGYRSHEGCPLRGTSNRRAESGRQGWCSPFFDSAVIRVRQPFSCTAAGRQTPAVFTLRDGAGVLASPSKSADIGTAPRISSAWRRAGRYRVQHAACRRLRSRRFRAACPP